MCELLAMNCNTPTDISFSLTGFVKRGGETGEHADGWGISFYEQNRVRTFLDTAPAAHSHVVTFIQKYPVRSLNVLAHIRKANIGDVTLRNTQPFERELWGQYWTYIHNGDLHDYYPNRYSFYHPVGETDSERAFCVILDSLQRQLSLSSSANQVRDCLQDTITSLAQYGIFNCVISNGVDMFVHKSSKLHAITRAHPFSTATLADEAWSIDFTQVTQPNDRVTVIATHPLTTDEQWLDLPVGQVIRLSDGVLHI